MSPKLQANVNLILDTFTGADGGVSFTKFRALIEDMERRQQTGDEAAGKVVEVVHQFARLTQVAK